MGKGNIMKISNKIIGKIIIGKDVLKRECLVYDRVDSHLSTHPIEGKLLKEALLKLNIQHNFSFMKQIVSFKENIGYTTCVPTTEEDEIYYKVRPFRKGETRFVKNREPLPCNKINIILKKEDNKVVLVTAYIGNESEPEPWDRQCKFNPELKKRAEEFWATHALIEEEPTCVVGS